MKRAPVVADRFYPGDPDQLRQMLLGFLSGQEPQGPALMAVSPHAGYVYSGRVAGMVLGRVELPRRVLILGPNHSGRGAKAALMSRGSWLTPLGEAPLDAELGQAITRECPWVEEDAAAHQFEHSLEVQVPFLQMRCDDLLLSALCLGWLEYDQCRELGQALARAVESLGEPVLIVASTDMSHYEPAEAAERKDRKAMERIQALDPQGLFNTVRAMNISMCGVLPTSVGLVAALELGASQAELVAYTNSGEASGDFEQVVGYAGLIVK